VGVDSVYLWMIGAPVVVVAASVLTASAFRQRRDRLLDETGRHAFGRVLATGRDDDGLGSISFWIKVEYAYDGELVRAKVIVSQREQQRYQVGQRVGLTYAPSRSQVVRLDPPEWAVRQA
jgi:hypothetical protein